MHPVSVSYSLSSQIRARQHLDVMLFFKQLQVKLYAGVDRDGNNHSPTCSGKRQIFLVEYKLYIGVVLGHLPKW